MVSPLSNTLPSATKCPSNSCWAPGLQVGLGCPLAALAVELSILRTFTCRSSVEQNQPFIQHWLIVFEFFVPVFEKTIGSLERWRARYHRLHACAATNAERSVREPEELYTHPLHRRRDNSWKLLED